MASSASGQSGLSSPVQTTAQPEVATTADRANTTSQQLPEEEDIPELTHMMPAIFVPLQEDLLEPIEQPKDLTERLQRMLASLDANEKAVKDNFAWMFEREARRHVIAAKKTRDFSSPPEPKTMSWDEAEKMFASMSAKPAPNTAYHLPPEKIAGFKMADSDSALMRDLSPHERTTREVLVVADKGYREMQNYSNYHINGIRDRLNESLESEKKREAEFAIPLS